MSHQSNQNKEFYNGHRSSDSTLIKYRNNNDCIKAVKKSDNDYCYDLELFDNQIEIEKNKDRLQNVSNSFAKMDFLKKHD